MYPHTTYLIEYICSVKRNLFANVNHIPYDLILERELHTTSNLIPRPLLACQLICIFSYQICTLHVQIFFKNAFVFPIQDHIVWDAHLLHQHDNDLQWHKV